MTWLGKAGAARPPNRTDCHFSFPSDSHTLCNGRYATIRLNFCNKVIINFLICSMFKVTDPAFAGVILIEMWKGSHGDRHSRVLREIRADGTQTLQVSPQG